MSDQPYDHEQDEFVPCAFGSNLPDGVVLPSSFEVTRPQPGEPRCILHGRVTLHFSTSGVPEISVVRVCQWHAAVARLLHVDQVGAIKADLLPGVTL